MREPAVELLRTGGPGAGPDTGVPEPAGARRSTASALLVAVRPRQWVKNLLVFAAPAAAAVLTHPVALARTTGAAVAFCAASAGTYLINDSIDAEADRLHPTKRLRPIAARELSRGLALGIGTVLLVCALAGGAAIGGLALAAVIGAYLAITLSYSFALKHVPVVELLCISAGFLLRAVAGGVAAHVPLSPWFLVVATFGSLFVAAGKRSTEFAQLGDDRGEHRAALSWYRERSLRWARRLSATVTVGAYAAWAVARAAMTDDRVQDGLLLVLSVVPFAVAAVLVDRAIERGHGGAPEEIVLKDHVLQVVGFLCCVLVVIGLDT
ncbi:MAG: decaprenyl-phosphate phosphoribosyltransferase [Acidimicrobiales bacterium]